MAYYATHNVTVHGTRRDITLTKGDKLTAAQVAKLTDRQLEAYTTTKRPSRATGVARRSTKAEMPINTYLEVFMAAYQAGETLPGNYRDVFSQVAITTGSTARWAGYRGNHIAEAGRRFETATGVSFETIAPDLRETAGDWVSAIA